jgi:hypothetical protein
VDAQDVVAQALRPEGTEDRVDQVGDERVHQRGERRTDDDADREVDGVPAGDEVSESLEHEQDLLMGGQASTTLVGSGVRREKRRLRRAQGHRQP